MGFTLLVGVIGGGFKGLPTGGRRRQASQQGRICVRRINSAGRFVYRPGDTRAQRAGWRSPLPGRGLPAPSATLSIPPAGLPARL